MKRSVYERKTKFVLVMTDKNMFCRNVYHNKTLLESVVVIKFILKRKTTPFLL